MARPFYLGIEGGATRTSGVLADGELRVLARATAGPSNVHAVGEAEAEGQVARLVGGLLTEAGVRREEIAAAAFCMAGLRNSADHATWWRIARAIGIPGRMILTHDAAAGLAAGSPDGTGVLVVCGTGSLVYGRRSDGREHFVGGRGPVLGDEGSGFDVGHRALRAACRAADGRGRATLLERLIPERLGLGGTEELVAWVSPFAKDRVASVAPIVFEAAAAGDPVAEAIIQAAAEELGVCVAVVAQELWPEAGVERLERVVFSGGVLIHQAGFRAAVASLVCKVAPQAQCVLSEIDGAMGAARLARRSG